MSRRAFLGALSLGGSAALLAACQAAPSAAPTSAPAPAAPKVQAQAAPAAPALAQAPAAPPAAASSSAEWDQLVAAAKREGEVNVYAGISGGLREAIEPFQDAFPGIKINGTYGPARDIVAKLLAERQAGKYIPDVIMGPATEAVLTLKPAGALAPLDSAFVLPEVSDTAAWFGKKLWWMDARQPYTTLRFQGYVGTTISYNTQLVDPKQFTSYKDLLDPKWKGKIVANDIRRAGQGGLQVRFMYANPDLGPPFIERLFSEQDIQISSDHRQMIDWIGQGRYLLGLWVSSSDLKLAASQGVPVLDLSGEQMKEGAPLASGGGTISIGDQAPHPNAMKVFVNWMLGKAGQISWQKNVKQPSLRIDIPKDGLDPGEMPKPNVPYADIYNEDYWTRITPEDVAAVVDRALEKAGNPGAGVGGR